LGKEVRNLAPNRASRRLIRRLHGKHGFKAVVETHSFFAMLSKCLALR
jgi:hypothetical protein